MSTAPVAAEQLRPSQVKRRGRVIRAALELGAEGGYDAVQMRDVAQRAQVALGTIYRYFSSKDHLLAAALVEWVEELEQRVNVRPPRGDTIATNMVDILRRATRAMEREPKLSAAVITALSSNDPQVAGCQHEMGEGMTRIPARAVPAGLDGEVPDRIIPA